MADARSVIVGELDGVLRSSNRRDFLRLLAIGGAGIFLPTIITACSSDTTGPSTPVAVDLSTDAGILNYAYALEQLESEFYRRVIASRFIGMTALELSALAIINAHETQHRQFLQSVVTNRINDSLAFDFSSINFSDRASVMTAAQTFEDLGVAAYNGIAGKLTDGDKLLIAGKIVSVEARHAATIRQLNDIASGAAASTSNTGFAGDDVVNPTSGLDVASAPPDVLAAAGKYFRTPFTARGA
jgi:ferritin-like metal-binding protein YciE